MNTKMNGVQYKLGSDEYLMDVADRIIGELVHEKEYLYKAYDYYNGIRDKYQYENLETNYGIGNPTSVEFVPLIRKHIDAIVGEYLTTKIAPKISCKDEKTLHNIFRDKQLEIAKKTKDWVSLYLSNAIWEAISGKTNEGQPNQDPLIDLELKQIKESVERNFISNYEIAAQNIVLYILQSRKIDFKNKLWQMILDLLIAGQAYYKVLPTSNGSNFKIEVYSPLNVFVEKDPKSKYMKNGYKSVVRKWMTTLEIAIKYGDYLSEDELASLDDYVGYNEGNDHFILVTGLNARCGGYGWRNPGMWHETGVHPEEDFSEEFYNRKWNLIPVYEVEWIDYKKEKNGKIKGIRYNVIRIGSEIYVLNGEDGYAVRDMDAPNEMRLSLNGMFYQNGNGAPYSLMLATTSLQDKYDLLHYMKDNVIALSGTKGAIIDVAHLPEFLGNTIEERLIKFWAYRKNGMSLIDSSQEGESPNQIYNGFDDSVNVNTILAVDLAIERIETTASSITGVFRERLGGILQRDAVANVEVGMLQSFIITKLYYLVMDTLVQEILTDSLNMAKLVFKKGITGQLILGNTKEIFTLLPEYYSFTDYDIHLSDSTEIMKEQETLKQLAIQLAQNGQVDPELLIIITTSLSLTDMKNSVLKSIAAKKMENDQLGQMQQQLQLALQQVEQMQKQLEQTTKQLATLNKEKLNIERADNEIKNQIQWYKVKSDAANKEKELDLIKDRNKLEALLLVDDNPNNDEVLNNKR